MMKTKLIIVLTLFFALAPEGVVLAEMANSNPALKADGVSGTQRRKRRRVQRKRKARVYGIQVMPEETQTAPAPEAAPEPAPVPEAAAPPAQEAPMTGGMPPPPPPASDPMDAPGRGRPSKRGPRIKPPTTRIKPPTR